MSVRWKKLLNPIFLFSLLIRGIGIVMLPPVRLLIRLFGFKQSLVRRTEAIQQLLGLLTLLIGGLVLMVIYGGWPLLAILVLHTWAMLVYSKCESFLKIHVGKRYRMALLLLQIAFLVVLLFLDFSISLPIVLTFLVIAKLSDILLHDHLLLYTSLLAQDRFDAYYWWKKKRSPRSWKRSLNILVKRRYIHSMVQIVRQFLKLYDEPLRQHRFAPELLEGWIKLRKYQILPDDEVLNPSTGYKKGRVKILSESLIGTACNFELMNYWLQKANSQKAYMHVLLDFLAALQSELEAYVQMPSAMEIEQIRQAGFIAKLDQFLEEDVVRIEDDELRGQVQYCYGLYYVTTGIMKNV